MGAPPQEIQLYINKVYARNCVYFFLHCLYKTGLYDSLLFCGCILLSLKNLAAYVCTAAGLLLPRESCPRSAKANTRQYIPDAARKELPPLPYNSILYRLHIIIVFIILQPLFSIISQEIGKIFDKIAILQNSQ